MKGKVIAQGDVLVVALPSHEPKGHEREGYRTAIVVGVPKGEVRISGCDSYSPNDT